MLCPKCENKGYVQALITPDGPGKEPKQTAMFCRCSAGVNLQMLTIDLRLSDLQDIAADLIPKLQRIQTLLHTPDEAGKLIEKMIQELQQQIAKIDQALNELGPKLETLK